MSQKNISIDDYLERIGFDVDPSMVDLLFVLKPFGFMVEQPMEMKGKTTFVRPAKRHRTGTMIFDDLDVYDSGEVDLLIRYPHSKYVGFKSLEQAAMELPAVLQKQDDNRRPNMAESRYILNQGTKMKITKTQLRKIIREALGDRGDLPQKHQYKIGMTGGDLPPGKVTSKIPNAKYDPELPPATTEKQWVDWAEGYGMFPEYDNDGQMLFYYMMDDDVDGTITNEAEFLGGALEPAPYPSQTTMIYTGVYR